ncbi:hypothetical protein QTG54_012995 [Skeletonema marinoi]|uniref:Uncharacterized protein n=1 Tax=Skeletonema marinoi TaxID=267567 RepID=A0AAD9D867_9STRA|nr:hypothetical protein QTG54_012995 [Skeletonema marinoi]
MSSSAADLAKLQAAVKDLQSTQLNLPQNHHRSNNNKENATNTTNTTPFTNPHLLQNYKSARETYIQQRTTELFLDHLQQYNATTHTLSLPAPVDPSERSALQSRQTEILANIQETMESVNGGMEEVKVKYAAFEEKREEFVQIVEGMERQRIIMSDDDHMDEEEEDGEEITEQDVAEQQDHLHQLQQRKLDLENRLRSDDCHRTKQVVNEVREKTGRKPLDWSGFTENENGGTDVEYICNVDNEIVELQEKAAELKQSSDFYDGIRELMEELGGVKILSSVLSLVGIRLKKSSSVGGGETTTPTTFPMPESQPETMTEDTENLTETINQSLSNVSLSKIMSQKQTVSIVIPPLDDLVKWSRSLESSQGIRFVLVETMARIRTLDARVVELTHLRQNYAAQVYDIETNLESAQFGGAEQEVVCAINEGSVYISELFGVGDGRGKLAALKKVVEERRCKGPVEVMEVMVKEFGGADMKKGGLFR